jgi:hypothetical protein
MERHKLLPFHKIKMWNGKYFTKTTLHDQGYILHLEHQGGMCPNVQDTWMDIPGDKHIREDMELFQDCVDGKPKDIVEDGLVNMVHTTGVFKHKVRWCQCQEAL